MLHQICSADVSESLAGGDGGSVDIGGGSTMRRGVWNGLAHRLARKLVGTFEAPRLVLRLFQTKSTNVHFCSLLLTFILFCIILSFLVVAFSGILLEGKSCGFLSQI